jgi:glycosyltransferase involved in cell wall biosynthesis
VTIAIPTLNRAGYLQLALESALGQTYNNTEVIVSNNASTDHTASYLASCTDPRLRVLQQASLIPMTANWNACVAAATGEYFLLLSDDDLLEPQAVGELVAGFEKLNGQPPPGIVYGGGCIIDSDGHTTRLFRPSPPREDARNLIVAFFQGNRDLRFCAVLLRTADLLPGFPTTYKVACDAAVWIKAVIQYGSAIFIPKQLVSYRHHQNLSSATQLDVWRDDNRQLLELAIAEDVRAGKPDPEFAKRLSSLMQRVDRDIIIGRINETFCRNKGKALLEYGRRLPAFASPRGLILLGKGVVSLFLNEKSRSWLRRWLKKRPVFE